MLGYWLGNTFLQTAWEEDLTELALMGPLSQIMSKKFPLHLYMADTFMESLGREDVKKNKLQYVRTYPSH